MAVFLATELVIDPIAVGEEPFVEKGAVVVLVCVVVVVMVVAGVGTGVEVVEFLVTLPALFVHSREETHAVDEEVYLQMVVPVDVSGPVVAPPHVHRVPREVHLAHTPLQTLGLRLLAIVTVSVSLVELVRDLFIHQTPFQQFVVVLVLFLEGESVFLRETREVFGRQSVCVVSRRESRAERKQQYEVGENALHLSRWVIIYKLIIKTMTGYSLLALVVLFILKGTNQ